jgi:hypothetical protein
VDVLEFDDLGNYAVVSRMLEVRPREFEDFLSLRSQ